MLRKRIQRQVGAVTLIALMAGALEMRAADDVSVTEITASCLVLGTASGNVVASIGPDGALLIGTPPASSTEKIASLLDSRTKSTVRYLVIAAQGLTQSQGDTGWQRRGAFVAMQENALGRLGGGGMGAPKPLPPHFAELGFERPRIAFSEVLKFDMNGDAIHIVHQKPGYSDADFIAHFHGANLVYFGEVFPGDGYPAVDVNQGGALDGFLSTLEPWTTGKMRFVPARGGVVGTADVKAFRGMIATVRDRVQAMVKAGKGESQVIAAHPTTEFDARWGHGRLTPDAFVREVYSAVSKK